MSVLKPTTIIEPQKGILHLNLKDLWEFREMLYFLVWRDVIVRYKQTVIGATWVMLQPLITMTILTIIFGRLAKIPSDGVPYPVFAFAALLPWGYFSQAFMRTSSSVVNNSNLVTKIYFPRLLIPVAAAIAPVVDFVFSFLLLIILMLWYKVLPCLTLLLLPLFLAFAIVTTLAFGLWAAAMNVKYRDIGTIVPFVIQVWMYASPVVYPITIVPTKWRLLYSLNPMVGVIEGFRWAILGNAAPNIAAMVVSAITVIATLIGGVMYFKKAEKIFADVI